MTTLKCTCQWIDMKGEFTPDTNDAIGLAVCHDPRTFGEKGSEPFLICDEHAKRKSTFWKILPLPGQPTEAWHAIVQFDDAWFRVVPDVAIEAIKKAFPHHAQDILGELRWSEVNGCFYFTKWGMYVGVELDGYIHT